MLDVLSLYEFAKQQNIEVIQMPLKECKSMSIMSESGSCYIGIDDSVHDSGIRERVHLSHEIGHCITGSFYNRYSPVDIRQKHENTADKWAIKKIISLTEFDDAIASGCTEIWELADRFGVTEDFMRKAVCLYTHGNVATDLYFSKV